MITPSNGYLDGNGSSPFAAHADHEHDAPPENPSLLKAQKITIAVDDWDNDSASVDLPEGLKAYVTFVVDNASKSVADTAVLELSEVGTATLTFGVTETPTDPIDIYVMYL